MSDPPAPIVSSEPELQLGSVPESGAVYGGRFALRGVGLRQLAARGTLVNGMFLLGVSLLNVLRGFVLALFLSTRDYGLIGILAVSVGTLLWLKQVGIGDKYIQQSDPDQELAFQRAFTLEAMMTAGFMLLLLVATPLIALIYGRSAVIAPILVFILAMPAIVLQTPLWIHYRRMNFLRQRLLQAIDPTVTFVVAVGLAIAGLGYWSLVLGILAGSWATGLASIRDAPYRLGFRYDRGTLRSYTSFSWPLLASSAGGTIIAQSSILATERHLGLAAAGALTLASSVTMFADRADAIVTGTLYPAICAVADRTELLKESFVKSNRLALMWAVPFGLGLTLFAPDLVNFVLGHRWHEATLLLQVFGAVAAVNHIGFNWDAYLRARNDTRPLAFTAGFMLASYLLVPIPLLFVDGLRGFAAGMVVFGLVGLVCRAIFLRRIFAGFGMLRHTVRAVVPSLLAMAPILAVRQLESGHRGAGEAAVELVAYLVLTVLATLALEGPLLREARSYLRRGAASVSVAARG